MQYKTFYLIILLGTSFLSFLYLFTLWLQRRKSDNLYLKESNVALFLIAFSFLYRSFIAANKLFDLQDFNLFHIVVDRIISSISNLIFLLSLSYFPLLNDENKFTKLFKKKEKWFIIVFFIIITVISLFTFLDKLSESLGITARVVIVVLDSLISISCILLVGYIMKLSLSGFKMSSVVLNFIMTSFILFSITQILLPLSKVLPDLLFEYYPIFLAVFIIVYFGFIISFFMYFISLEFVINEIQEQENNILLHSNNKEIIKAAAVSGLEIGFTNKLTSYLKVSIELSNGDFEHVTINNSKVLHPFLYWILFSIAKKNNIQLFNSDISVAKFRMIEYLNKHAENKVSQEILFSNDNGEYSLLIDASNITINEKEVICSKKSLDEIIFKYAECFIPVYENVRKNNFKTRNERLKEVRDNIQFLLRDILKF